MAEEMKMKTKMKAKMKAKMKERLKKYYWNMATYHLDGIGVIEVILILVIIIGLVLIFRNQIESIIQSAFESINGDSSSINTPMSVDGN